MKCYSRMHPKLFPQIIICAHNYWWSNATIFRVTLTHIFSCGPHFLRTMGPPNPTFEILDASLAICIHNDRCNIILPLSRSKSVKSLMGTYAVLSLFPVHCVSSLCFFTHGNEQVSTKHPGHLYFASTSWQISHLQ